MEQHRAGLEARTGGIGVLRAFVAAEAPGTVMRCSKAARGERQELAEGVNPKQVQEADFRREGPAGQCRLTADLVKTRSRPCADLRRYDPSTRLRLVAAVQIWQVNVGRSRYLTLVGSSGGSPLYLGT